MDFQTIAAIFFVLFLSVFIYVKKRDLILQKIAFPFLYLMLYRTKRGLGFMDAISRKFPRIVRFIGYLGVLVGFLGMIFISYTLIDNIIKLLVVGAAPPGVGLVLPFKVKGTFFVPFFYWIISIFIIALVHELSHGVVARAHDIKLKSSGFAFLGILLPILPAAFVEPDEDQLRKASVKKQLSVFAAGPFSNVVLALLILGLFTMVLSPSLTRVYDFEGVLVTGFMEGDFPARTSGMQPGEVIRNVDGLDVPFYYNFSDYMETKKPGDIVSLRTDKNTYDITLAAGSSDDGKGYLGVLVDQQRELRPEVVDIYGKYALETYVWFVWLCYWLIVLNLGIGLFNLLPLGILDGGRMVQAVLAKHAPNKQKIVWRIISTSTLIVLLANLLMGIF